MAQVQVPPGSGVLWLQLRQVGNGAVVPWHRPACSQNLHSNHDGSVLMPSGGVGASMMRWARSIKALAACFVRVDALQVQAVIVLADGHVQGPFQTSPVHVTLHLRPVFGLGLLYAFGNQSVKKLLRLWVLYSRQCQVLAHREHPGKRRPCCRQNAHCRM